MSEKHTYALKQGRKYRQNLRAGDLIFDGGVAEANAAQDREMQKLISERPDVSAKVYKIDMERAEEIARKHAENMPAQINPTSSSAASAILAAQLKHQDGVVGSLDPEQSEDFKKSLDQMHSTITEPVQEVPAETTEPTVTENKEAANPLANLGKK